MFNRAFWSLAGAVATCLAGLGAASGWARAHSPETLVRIASANSAVLPTPNGDYVVAVRCGAGITHLHRVSDLAMYDIANKAQVAGVLAGAIVAVNAARRLSGTTAVAAGVLGGSATDLLKGRFAAMRTAALPSEGSALIERVGKAGVLLVIAGVAFYGADYLFGRMEPGCDSPDLTRALDDAHNRYALQEAIYNRDRTVLNHIDPPRLDLANIGSIMAGSVRMTRINQVAFAQLGTRCAAAAIQRNRRVCEYL